MKITDSKRVDDRIGWIAVKTHGATFKILVHHMPGGAIHFSARTPDPVAQRRLSSIVDALNRRVPFDVYDLAVAT